MATITHREMKRCYFDDKITFPISKSIKRLRDYDEQKQLIKCDRSLEHRKKIQRISQKEEEEEEEQQYHCQVYLKLFPSTLKCSLDVIVKPINKQTKDSDDIDSILIAKSRIPKTIKPGVIRVRLVSALFSADIDVHEDPSLIKLETIKNQSYHNHFDKQFALILKNSQIGPGAIGKLFIEFLDPSNGSYTNNPPIFELNLNLASQHKIPLTSSHQKSDDNIICSSLKCGCILSSDQSRLSISDKCNLILDDMKLVHRLAEPLRCLWKSIGRELSPCFSEIDLDDFNQRYFLSEGNQECTYQLLREWYTRDPHQANIRYLLTRLQLPFHIVMTIHNNVVRTFSLS
ncbi:unnamed protein product [Rotaria sordida]|uniref:Death domain-containing protein n=1 Tax=Rotaria sordida TaxID=392033 RepID=A0A818XZJ9_9BILA|nr:unnamed protein product [Rotaria sordida]CAF1044951.1 unnamed protein product [Rotaria sordida]CAF3748361.1 unnamed protein product [Rotaria sordida]CAF3838763.1 unnamed protein product [Rotaria sordida]